MNEGRFLMGVDESGTGAWAGPFCVGAVVLPYHLELEGVTDSKKLSDKKRRAVVDKILDAAIAADVGFVYPRDIREKGQALAWQDAIVMAVKFVIDDLKEKEIPLGKVDIMIDGSVNHRLRARVNKIHPGMRVYMEAKADQNHLAVGAASILAKTARNDCMNEIDEEYPEYGFKQNSGYGTEDHAMALSAHGRTKHHRPLTDDWPLPERRD